MEKLSRDTHTLELILRAGEDQQERFIGELGAFGFERFWQEEHRLRAYIPAARWSEALHARVEKRLRELGVEGPLSSHALGEENWNRFWEESLIPITAGPFLIKPTWTDAPADHDARFVLEIDPKMSFGTGHHESTRLVLRLLAEAGAEGARVLDAGTGTGVLALAAVRLGATSVLAFDTDERVLENARENTAHNDVADRIELRAGTLAEVVPESDEGFDLILANINRNAHSELLSAYREKLNPGGRVILGGLLLSDRAPMLTHAAACGLVLDAELEENEWWAVRLGIEEGG